jgi:transposase-like protein
MVWGGSFADADARVLTEAVMDEVRQWQNRPLEDLYPIMYVDCLVIKVRENQRILEPRRSIWCWALLWKGKRNRLPHVDRRKRRSDILACGLH